MTSARLGTVCEEAPDSLTPPSAASRGALLLGAGWACEITACGAVIEFASALWARIEAARIEQRFDSGRLGGVFCGRRFLRVLMWRGHRRTGRCRTGAIRKQVATGLSGHAAVRQRAFVIAVVRQVLVCALLLRRLGQIERLGRRARNAAAAGKRTCQAPQRHDSEGAAPPCCGVGVAEAGKGTTAEAHLAIVSINDWHLLGKRRTRRKWLPIAE
jgi:hypothetical protein